MALRLISEIEFFADLSSRGFVQTDLRMDDLMVWNLNDEPYTIPMPISNKDDYTLYCPFAIELFFKHVFGEDCTVETKQHEDKNFNVFPIKKPKK